MRRSNPEAAAWAYDLLPNATRWIVKVFSRFFPPLHHVNIQLRTTFLDDRTRTIATKVRSKASKSNKPTRIRLVVVGAGYDTRSLRFLESGVIDEAIEIDLEHVVEAKKALLGSASFQNRRPNCKLPSMASVNLNDMETTNVTLTSILNKEAPGDGEGVYTIFLLEGILVHLESGAPAKVLKLLRTFCNDEDGCLIFCDCIQGVTNRSLELAQSVLKDAGWYLKEFLATPTRTPHFGVAEVQE